MVSFKNYTKICLKVWARDFEHWADDIWDSFSGVFLVLHSVYGGEE